MREFRRRIAEAVRKVKQFATGKARAERNRDKKLKILAAYKRQIDNYEERIQELLKVLDQHNENHPEEDDRDLELEAKIEELRASKGDLADRRNKVHEKILPRIRRQLGYRGKRLRAWAERRHRLRKRYEAAKDRAAEEAADSDGLTSLDGKQVASWMVPWILKIRARGNWKGVVVSAYRTPEYSEGLCLQMCGAPSCPGTCAGRASGHSQKAFPGGCIDVSDYYTFAAEARAVGAPFFNDLPNDRVHFSNSGH